MIRVLLLSKYSRLGASSRLRTQQYIPYLTENEFDVTVSPLFDDIYLKSIYDTIPVSKTHLLKLFISRLSMLFSVSKYDVVWLEYEAFPYLPSFAEQLFNFFGVKVIVDYDDAIFHNYDLSTNPIIKRFLRNKIDTVMHLADHVVVGNHYLRARALDAGVHNITLIPTVVDYLRYPVKETYELNNGEAIRIGWIGSPSTQQYVLSLAPVFLMLAQRFNIKVVLVGATAAAKVPLEGINTEVLAWSEEREAEFVSSMDIGIMPLKDGPWEKGKCGYKLIQYMACGVPVIASPVGVNTTIVNEHACGYLAETHEDWYQSFTSLINDPSLRRKVGTNGRQSVINYFSLQAQQSVIKGCFSSVLN